MVTAIAEVIVFSGMGDRNGAEELIVFLRIE